MNSNANRPARVERHGNIIILTLVGGALRDTGDMLVAELEGRAAHCAGGGHLLVDFSNVVQLSAAELGTLVNLQKAVSTCGGRLTLFNVCPAVYDVVATAELQSLLSVCREESLVLPGACQGWDPQARRPLPRWSDGRRHGQGRRGPIL